MKSRRCKSVGSHDQKRRKLDGAGPATLSPGTRRYSDEERRSSAWDLQRHAARREVRAAVPAELIPASSSSTGYQADSRLDRGDSPKYGVVSVCGRRGDMEDAVAVHLSFCRRRHEFTRRMHYFGVYDGHGCSHVASKCSDRMHKLMEEELEAGGESSDDWKEAMARSFVRMDKEVSLSRETVQEGAKNCRCNLQKPECDAVGSTAVVSVVTLDKIVVANCGDSRAVLCRKGKPVPLSSDHKVRAETVNSSSTELWFGFRRIFSYTLQPDRPDELRRIEDAGGRVIYWDVARVMGVLAMSRAIGDGYLKPYVSCLPDVEIVDRDEEDDCLILGSDGLWDVVTNEMACKVARICLQATSAQSPSAELAKSKGRGKASEKACADAAALLTKLALARHSTDNISVVVVDLRRA